MAGLASATGISQYDGGDLAGLLTLAGLTLFVTCVSLLWSFGMLQQQRAAWLPLCRAINGEYSVVLGGVRGTWKDLPVVARVESSDSNSEYLDATSALYSSSKQFFALTITLPFSDDASWRALFQPRTATRSSGEWHVVCYDSKDLETTLENAGVADLFSEWDRFTVVKCNAPLGEITLRYPVPQRSYCPGIEEAEIEINLLRRVGEIWQHAAAAKLAA